MGERIHNFGRIAARIAARSGSAVCAALIVFAPLAATAADWEQFYGGPRDDVPLAIAAVPGGGHVLVGYTESAGKGKADVWVLRLDDAGKQVWEKTFGGPEADTADDVRVTADGSIVIAGSTRSKGAGETDAWAILLNSAGEQVWEKTFGGTDYDAFESVEVASDGGFVFAGYNRSKNGGKQDAWIVRTDAKGEQVWEKTFGGDKDDYVKRIVSGPNGTYVAAGYQIARRSTVGNGWVLKVDDKGAEIWQRAFPATKHDWFTSLAPAGDGHILAGYTESNGAGREDAWAVLIDAAGAPVWDRTYGGKETDGANAVAVLPPEHAPAAFVLAGTTRSGQDVVGDGWVIWLDAAGKNLGEASFGGKNIDTLHAVISAADKQVVTAGANTSSGAGAADGWVRQFSKGAAAAGGGSWTVALTDTRWSWIWLVAGLVVLVLGGAVAGAVLGRRGTPKREKKKSAPEANKPKSGVGLEKAITQEAPELSAEVLALAKLGETPEPRKPQPRVMTKEMTTPVDADYAAKVTADLDQLVEEVDSGQRALGAGTPIPLAEDVDEVGQWVLLGYDEDGSSIQYRFGPMMLGKAGDGLVMGRDPDLCHLAVINSSVSRRHLRFTLDDGRLLVEDLNSTNGSYLDGRRLRPLEPARLRHGASLILGDFFLRYVIDAR